jgi:hypothetical protein
MAADLARRLAISLAVRGLNDPPIWNACLRIFMLSIPVMTTEVGRLNA